MYLTCQSCLDKISTAPAHVTYIDIVIIHDHDRDGVKNKGTQVEFEREVKKLFLPNAQRLDTDTSYTHTHTPNTIGPPTINDSGRFGQSRR